MPSSDLTAILGAPELAPAPTIAPHVAASIPPLPNEPDDSLIARAAVAEGDQNNPDSWKNVGGVIRNRMAASGKSAAEVLTEPNAFSTYHNGRLQSVDTKSPAFQSALQTVQGVKAGDVPYDSFYAPKGMPGGAKAQFDDGSGTLVGTQLFFAGKYHPGSSALASALGLTPEEQKALAPYTGGPATTEAAKAVDPGNEFNFGPNFAKLSAAAASTFHNISKDPKRGLDPNAPEGSEKLPYYVTPGTVAPVTPGIHWVDVNGVEHINPGGALERAQGTAEGLVQGLGPDSAASATKLTGGGLGVPSAEPGLGGMSTALAGAFGGQDIGAQARATEGAVSQQQRDYAIKHLNDPYAQAGRFIGQAIPATAAAMAIPEVDVPGSAFAGARGLLARTGGRVATNALRGTAAAAANVGPNNQPVSKQLEIGALGGIAVPEVAGLAGRGAAGITGMGRTVSPEVANLADIAQTKYGIPLQSGQVMGAGGDRAAATAYSNMLGHSENVRATNVEQRQKWMQGVTNTYGDPSGSVAPEALAANRARIGGTMNDIAARTNIVDTRDLTQKLDEMVAQAKGVVGKDKLAPIRNLVANIKSVIQPDGSMPGEAYQAMTDHNSSLQAAVDEGDSKYPGRIMDAMHDTLQKSATPEDVKTLQQARWQYKNLMTVARAAQNQNNIGIDGVFTPSALNTATTSNFKGRAFQGAGDLDELNAIRSKIMKEPANSFTPERLIDFSQGLKTGGAAAGLAELGMMAAHQPQNALPAAIAGTVGLTSKAVSNLIKQNKIGGSAASIIARSLPNAPRTALSGVRGAGKAVEVPLSALAGVKLLNAAPVGANAQ